MKAITLLCLVAVAFAASGRRQLWQNEENLRNAEPFRAGQEYTFRYNTQIASGLGRVDSIDQKATHRLSANVKIHFETERSAILRFEEVRVGALNGDLVEPRRVQPMQLFEEKQIESELLEQLQMPMKVDYVDGLVERIFFHQKDSSWSKNIKRAVLNMMQLNLKRRAINIQESEIEQLRNDDKTTQSRMFTLPEITLEGECQTVYTINKVEESERREQEVFNVTKTIDFKQCKKIAAMRYGPRAEKPDVESKQQEIEEQQLERSTVLRYQLIGTPEKYAIGRVEVLSHYVYKSLNAESQQPMQTVVAGQLTFESVEKKSSKSSLTQLQSKEETLLYSTEWDKLEKRFYQYGDDEFSRQTAPFATVQNKVEQVLQILRKLAHAVSDKVNGIETETTLKLQKLVEIVRMCSVEELKQIRQQIKESSSQTEQQKQEEMFTDVLAIAGTRNTIHQLVEEILKQKISTGKAVQALQQLSGLPAPSDKQIDTMLRLCNSEVAQRSGPLRQSCWLTAGSMIGELCKETVHDNVHESEEQCPRHKKEKYQKALLTEFNNADTEYEKVLALKTLGNAAIDLAVFDLEKIINDRRESPVVRQQAIDALRRLRNQMPRKIQRILMPIFKNTQEQPEVRMTAFSMIMHTIPDKAVLDQITYMLFNERSQHVKSFVYTTMKALSQSPVEVEQKMAQHLKTVLKMANIQEEELRGSRYYRVPIYSQEQREGLFVNWESLFSTNNMLPKHMALHMDSMLNGLFEKNNFELSLTQNDLEHYYEQLMETMSSSRNSLRAGRRSSVHNGQEELDSIFDDLKIQNRRENSRAQPFGMFCIRMRDVDQVILPISEETMPESLKPLLRGEKPSLSSFWKLLEGKHFRLYTVGSFHERSMKIATTAGMPLRMLHTIPVVASVEGELKLKIESDGMKIFFKAQPMMSGVHSQKMELWTPIVNTGVESLRFLEMNLPIETEIMISGSNDDETTEKAKMVIRLPEQKTRIFGFHSLPLTFVRDFDSKTKLHREPKVKTLRNVEMEPRLVELSSESESAWTVSGHMHKPARLTYQNILAIAKVTENHVHIEFEPTSSSPKEIVMTIFGKLFKPVEKVSMRPQFESFYESSKKFEPIYNDDYESMDELESESERRQKLNKYVSDEYKPRQMYKHAVKATYKTVGGRQQHQGQFELTAVCDAQLRYCKIDSEMRRSPLARENKEWTMIATAQIMTPEYVREVSELNEMRSNKQNKLVATFEAEWGSDKNQKVQLKLQGERAVPQKWIQRSGSEWRREMATAFINKYDVLAYYQVSEETESFWTRMYEYLKVWNMWNTESSQMIQGRDNHVLATIIIDPRTRQHLNVSVKTPTERVRFTNIQLPTSVKPLPLIRNQEQPREIDSVSELFEDMSDSRRAECRVNGQRIKTFDDVIYKAPIGPCYSVIAKDCARKTFAVMMKQMDEQSQDKKIKIVTKDTVIEMEPKDDKLSIKVNGEKMTEVESLQEYNIDYSDDFVMVNLPQGVSVRFDGQQVTVKMSQFYKNSQCGLCGHYDEEDNDEFRLNDNTITEDLKEFHKSYTFEDKECQKSQYEKMYEQDSLFEKKASRKDFYNQKDDEESGFESDEDVEEYEFFGRKQNMQNQKNQQDMNEQEDDEETETEQRQEPVKMTKVIEHNHKICFSMKPVKQCRRGFYPEDTEEQKVQFTCMTRSSESRRLHREARQQDITEKLSDKKPSYVEAVSVPTKCSQY
ncbi:hypothetical protein FO519_003113 [Halicephalobus sp. NKZ332]|nr:hypothetical protein FO519_003113 [Halicephalobus sp. NKZ332]